METTLIAPEPPSTPERPTPPPPSSSPGPWPGPWPWPWPRITRSGWITAAIAALATALYTGNLAVNGSANEYYTAAVRSASVSWKAFFFGSIDPGNFITVDKPPAALWLQALSVRIFGFSSWAMLVPEALCGVASVLILHRMVRRWAGDTAAHLAALALALTPVAVLMFRFNNPDALLTLLCLAAAWALWSALETGRTRGLVISGLLIGLAFETKMLQAFVVLPAFVVVYLVAGKPRLLHRLAQLTAALAAVIVSSGWWIAVVALWPAADRPYIGSTSDNSILSLLFGYNGLSRLFGNSGGAAGGGAPGGAGGAVSTGFGGAVGWLRMFNTANGGQIAWLIPMAVAGLAAGLWLTRRAPRTDLRRAGWLLWGLWAVSCFVTFSRAEGVFHPYYTVQLAPPVAALAGAGGLALWRLGRTSRAAALGPARRHRRQRGGGGGPALADADLPPVAAPARRRRRGGGHRRAVAGVAPAHQGARDGRRRRGHRNPAGRARRLRLDDRAHPGHRLDRVRRAERHDRRRDRWGPGRVGRHGRCRPHQLPGGEPRATPPTWWRRSARRARPPSSSPPASP